jgi:hypothetical protein
MEEPQIKLKQMYSLYLYNNLEIIFESLDMLNHDEIKQIKEISEEDSINKIIVVKDIFTVNCRDKELRLIGNKINSTQYIINKDGRGDIFHIKYTCSNTTILKGLEYLYHIYKNISEV